jgi:hypothetical protein
MSGFILIAMIVPYAIATGLYIWPVVGPVGGGCCATGLFMSEFIYAIFPRFDAAPPTAFAAPTVPAACAAALPVINPVCPAAKFWPEVTPVFTAP